MRPPSSATEARTAVDRARAQILELELAHRSGLLCPREAAEQAIYKLVQSDRDALLTLPSRAAPELAIEFDCPEAKAYLALDRIVRRHLKELAEIDIKLGDIGVTGGTEGVPAIRAGARPGNDGIGVGGMLSRPRKSGQRRARKVAE